MTSTSRKSYLSVPYLNYSLTDGTDIPAPTETPPKTPVEAVTPPKFGGGPLSSHPATPPDEKENIQESAMSPPARDDTDSFLTPTSPASAAQYSSSPQVNRKPSGVRKLLSLSNLRSSFSSSRTSLSLPRQSGDTAQSNGIKRPSSPSLVSTNGSSIQPRQPLRKKKSGTWFKRKSSVFLQDDDEYQDQGLAAVEERPDTRESKRLRESSPAPRESSPPPVLPDIGSLGGGNFGGGDMGWDERAFSR